MYLPKRFENQDIERSLVIAKKYPLATVISSTEAGPFISHLPLVAESKNGSLFLYGHLARANEHWKLLADRDVYVIFNGPQTYITPTWYAEDDVPTWNYAVVHMKGRSRLLENKSDIISCLEKITAQTEQNEPNSWKFWIPDDLAEKGVLEKAIVGFQVTVDSIQSKFKLSQNRSPLDRQGVIQGLSGRNDDMSREIRRLMQETEGSSHV